MAHTICWNAEGITRNFSAQVSAGEILASNLKIYFQPKFELVKYMIDDFTEVTSHTVDNEYIKLFSSTDKIIMNTKGQLLIALIATQIDIINLIKSYQKEMRNSLFRCELFKNMEDAQSWVES